MLEESGEPYSSRFSEPLLATSKPVLEEVVEEAAWLLALAVGAALVLLAW